MGYLNKKRNTINGFRYFNLDFGQLKFLEVKMIASEADLRARSALK